MDSVNWSSVKFHQIYTLSHRGYRLKNQGRLCIRVHINELSIPGTHHLDKGFPSPFSSSLTNSRRWIFSWHRPFDRSWCITLYVISRNWVGIHLL
ncbi:Fibrocystin-L [Gossypium arboreum]|uniref:Fibrocystin-L n=1 Tax=Gossypium arboreum TaxID=29729 RepID=A0A0B0PKS1_GOSAR|nr:Fibrocystin-L [Gossypium arboreum]KHG23976.1 Fibrocystin-L [Gossypium arboreum]